jgi:hypothetical protein
MRPLFKPIVTVRRQVNLSLDELQKRVEGKPNYVRVGLPDAINTDEAKQVRKTKRTGRRKP